MRYTARDVANIVGLSVGQVRSYARAGFLHPERGDLGEMRFSFQDLLLLKAARDLMKARIPAARVRQTLGQLKRQLPRGRSLTGIRIVADGSRVVAIDGDTMWHPDSGQALLNFEVSEVARRVAPLARENVHQARSSEERLDAEAWYEMGYDLEPVDPDDARDAYRRALELDPGHVDAHINLGRLLHEAEELDAAAAHYRIALDARPDDATAAFNLGVALTDLDKLEDAVKAYEQAIRHDPSCADAYYNVAGIFERLGKKAAALRHLKTYKRLTENDG